VSRIAPNVIGFDDGPFPRAHRGDVLLVGVVSSRTRMDGVVSGRIRRDGANATRSMIELVSKSQFGEHIRAVLLQGIAVGGFNVVDTHALSAALCVPVLVVTRRKPDMTEVRRALFSGDPPDRPRVVGARRKWRLIQAAGELEEIGSPRLWVQRVGMSLAEARDLVRATTLHGNLPEPLRLAHLIAGGITTGKSRGRA
jgi:endonuclease V-like protein UPF0215 family